MVKATYRQEVVFYPYDLMIGQQQRNTISVPKKPDRVWTLFRPPEGWPEEGPRLPIVPVHHHNAFLEDYVHDWNWRDGIMRYYSRVTIGRVWLLLEYKTEES